jgi:hypothetical protein
MVEELQSATEKSKSKKYKDLVEGAAEKSKSTGKVAMVAGAVQGLVWALLPSIACATFTAITLA